MVRLIQPSAHHLVAKPPLPTRSMIVGILSLLLFVDTLGSINARLELSGRLESLETMSVRIRGASEGNGNAPSSSALPVDGVRKHGDEQIEEECPTIRKLLDDR